MLAANAARVSVLLLIAATGLAQCRTAVGATTVVDLNTPREFPQIATRSEWQSRAKEIREQVLVSCGLWPLPSKTDLHARVFGRVERDGYTIEKVALETFPGFYLGGNLYRPLGRGRGPFPAILNPHGHWANGRMADEKDGSIAARCIHFARQGMIAFSYDMVGYNDTRFADTPTNLSFSAVHHLFATNQADLLWNVSLMGLQTWNGIRALDFLETLPDVDRHRLACTGESGGGTQTFILGAVDERLAAQAPVVMVSHTMQGGCLCENAPGLRVQFSNMEIAAAPAPRPQLLVGASGDWTRDTLTVEGPSIARIYALLNARHKFGYVRYNFDHNYNQTSREAVYGFFEKWLLRKGDGKPVPEEPYLKEPDAELRVFPEGKLPAGALTQDQLIAELKGRHRRQWESLAPSTRAGLTRYKRVLLPAWRHALQLDVTPQTPIVTSQFPKDCGDYTVAAVSIQRSPEASKITAGYYAPASLLKNRNPHLAVVSGAEAHRSGGAPESLTVELLKRGVAVLAIEQFSSAPAKDQLANYFTTYNRTLLQDRVRDLVLAIGAAPSLDPRRRIPFEVALVGTGRAGLWALMAAPAADATVADCCRLNTSAETEYLAADLFCPGILNVGGPEGIGMLAAPKGLLLHNQGTQFGTRHLAAVFELEKATQNLATSPERLSNPEIAAWVAAVRK